jgi:hypothetical protein
VIPAVPSEATKRSVRGDHNSDVTHDDILATIVTAFRAPGHCRLNITSPN